MKKEDNFPIVNGTVFLGPYAYGFFKTSSIEDAKNDALRAFPAIDKTKGAWIKFHIDGQWHVLAFD